MAMHNLISVQVVYATLKRQAILSVNVLRHATIEMVIKQSGILDLFPELDLTTMKVGIFSEKRLLTDHVSAGDRIEIYRPLIIDPKEARRAKAKPSSQ